MFLKTDLRHFEFLDVKWNFSYFVLWHISWYPEKYLLTSRLMNSSLLCRGEDKQRGGTSFSKTVIRNDWTWALIEVLVLVTGPSFILEVVPRESCVYHYYSEHFSLDLIECNYCSAQQASQLHLAGGSGLHQRSRKGWNSDLKPQHRLVH